MPTHSLVRIAAIAAVVLLSITVSDGRVCGAEYFDLRLEQALVSMNADTRDWVRSPRIRITLVDDKAVLPVCETFLPVIRASELSDLAY